MICFKRNNDSNDDDLSKKLQSLLDMINDSSFDENFDEETDTDFYKGVDVSQIIDIIYKNLFTENYESIGLLIEKKSNNSLDLTIDKLK